CADCLLAPFLDVARWRFRGGGTVTRSCRTLRRGRLLSESTYARDRSTNRTWRTTRHCLSTHHEGSGPVGARRNRDRNRLCNPRRLADAQTTLRHTTMGFDDTCLCGRRVGSICLVGELPSRTTRGVSRSDLCFAR